MNEWILSDRFREVASRRVDAADGGKTPREGAVGSCVDVGVGLAVEDAGETRREGTVGSGIEVGVGPDRGEWGKKDSGDRDRTVGMQCILPLSDGWRGAHGVSKTYKSIRLLRVEWEGTFAYAGPPSRLRDCPSPT